jgi:8-oxo-dGTP pyrophosphatase MutT (NUDIX family)
MNTKIYFNNKFLEFVPEPLQDSENQSIKFFNEITEQSLKIIIDELLSENTPSKSEICYRTTNKNFKPVLDYLKNNLYYIEAAGGLIKKEDRFLFIYRLAKWDLPKGKLDKGETIEQAAVRECEEECGIKRLKIEQGLSSTFHVYKYKGKYALKQTYWFYMTSDYDKQLKPQTEENIEEVRWFTKEEIKKLVFANSYFTIKDVVNEALNERLI